MNVENTNVSAVQPAAKPPMVPAEPASDARASSVPAPGTARQATADTARQSAEAEMWKSQQRAAIAEKLVGANKSLVIEKDPEARGFIYKTVDRKTGEVVRVWPREEVASRLAALSDVDARGMMLDAKA